MSDVDAVNVHSREELAELLSREPALHLYARCDLDDRAWERTTWYGLRDASGALEQVALVYRGDRAPFVLALSGDAPPRMAALLTAITPSLPRSFHLQASPGVERALAPSWALTSRGAYLRLMLAEPNLAAPHPDLVPLGPADRAEVQAFYQAVYPENFFDPWLLSTGLFRGLRRDGALIAVAGVHAWSPMYRVAALGSIATHPDARGQGLGALTTSAVLRALPTGTSVGLNVHEQNTVAKRLYERLGFREATRYGEWSAATP